MEYCAVSCIHISTDRVKIVQGYCIFDMTPVAVLPSEAGDGLEEQDSYFIYYNTCVS